jgi:hypothetical protein
MSRKNFSEFIGFFPKGLNPFKILNKIQLGVFSRIYIKIPRELEVGQKRKFVLLEISYQLDKFGNSWTSRRLGFVFSNWSQLEIIEKHSIKRKNVNQAALLIVRPTTLGTSPSHHRSGLRPTRQAPSAQSAQARVPR